MIWHNFLSTLVSPEIEKLKNVWYLAYRHSQYYENGWSLQNVHYQRMNL